MNLSVSTLKTLNDYLKKLDSLRPISSSLLSKIKEQFQIEMTYNSNAIEGNSLTLKETFWVIQEGLTIKEKPLKDHLEAKNHNEALDYLYELIDREKNNTFSEHLIKEFHQLVVRDSQPDIAGIYRKRGVRISGSDHKPPSYLEVGQQMKTLVNEFGHRLSKKIHIIESAALLHHRLVNIHPFWDGNGRTSRLVMNVLIMGAGYPMAIILKNDRKRYYRVLAQADKGDFKPLCEFVAQAVIRSLNIYLKILKPSSKKSEKHVDLKTLSKKSPYSATYLRKLATKGKLEAFKEGRNWLSSEKALKRYINSINKLK